MFATARARKEAPGSRVTGCCGGSAPTQRPCPWHLAAPAHLHGERAGRRELPLRFRQLLLGARLAKARRRRVARVVAERLQHLYEEPQVIRAALRGAGARVGGARVAAARPSAAAGRKCRGRTTAAPSPSLRRLRAGIAAGASSWRTCAARPCTMHEAGAQPGLRGRPAARAGRTGKRAQAARMGGALRALCSASWLRAARASASAAAARSSSRRSSASRPCAARGGGLARASQRAARSREHSPDWCRGGRQVGRGASPDADRGTQLMPDTRCG